jgi:hypothetical protein
MAIICRTFAALILNHLSMQTIKIRVLSILSDGKSREICRHSVYLPEGVSFPFEDTIRILKVLYPKSDFVEICV